MTPLTRADASDLAESIRGLAILQALRSELPVAFDNLYETILRFSQLAQDFPQIIEMDVNPFLLFPEAEKCAAVEVRIPANVS